MKKIGVVEWYLPVQGPKAIDFCLKVGFEGMQMHDHGGRNANYPLLDERVHEMYEEELDGKDFTIYTLHPLDIARTPGIQYGMHTDLGAKCLENLKKTVKTCVMYNIPTIMLASFAGSKYGNKIQLQNTIDNLREYIKIAEANGVRIIYEGFSELPVMLRILNELPELKLTYDICNPLLFGFSEPLEDLAAIPTERIDCMHIKDADECLNATCEIGTGCVNVSACLDLLAEKKFDGWCFTETHYNELPVANDGHGIDTMIKDIAFLKKNWVDKYEG
ncbi:MAG: sugar phosphate isomerase/epimerase family protein [Lachnospiraceae bacterium]|jgi:sugar phosphate isomerase/epimerase